MGYPLPQPHYEAMIAQLQELHGLSEEYGWLSDEIMTQVIEYLRNQQLQLASLTDLIKNYGEAGPRSSDTYPDIPASDVSYEWLAVAGFPVYIVEPRDATQSTRNWLTHRRGRRGRGPDRPPEIEVDMYLEKADEKTVSAVEEAVLNLAREFGYGDFELIDEERGSLFRRWRAKARAGLDSDLAREAAHQALQRGSLELIGRPRAEVDAINTASAVALIKALENEANAAIRIGGLLTLKLTSPQGVPYLTVRELSPIEIRAVEQNPGIMRDPVHALELLALAVVQLGEEGNAQPNSLGDGTTS